MSPAAAADDGPFLAVSRSVDRVNAVPLDGATVRPGEQLAIFVAPVDAPGTRVRFFVNGNLTRTEFFSPWDLGGTAGSGLATLFPADRLQLGPNTVEAQVTSLLSTTTLTATVTLATPPPVETSLSGAVTFDGEGVPGIQVDLFAADAVGQRASYLRSVVTDEGGGYAFVVDAGCYVLVFVGPGVGSASSLVWQATGGPYQEVLACVEAGQTLSGLDAVLVDAAPPAEATITGVVVEESGEGVPGIAVDLFAADGAGQRAAYLRSVASGEGGDVTFGVDAGCYVLVFVGPGVGSASSLVWQASGGQYLEVPVCVEAGEVLAVPGALLVEGSVPVEATISGAVSLEGPGVPGVLVDLFAADAVGERAQFLGSTLTDEGGAYSFTVDPGCYVLVFVAPGAGSLVWQATGGRYQQVLVCADSGQTLSGINAVLVDIAPAGATIGGVIDTGDGVGIGGVTVDRFDVDEAGNRTQFLGSATTAEDGTYSFSVDAGCYVLVLIAPEGSAWVDTEGQFLEVFVCVESGGEALVSATLAVEQPVGAAISGTASDADGNPVAGVTVDVLQSGGIGEPIESAVTGDDGTYRISGLTTGSVAVRFTAPPGLAFTTTGLPVFQIPNIGLSPGVEITGLDVQVVEPAPATISGLVVDETGEPVADVPIRVYTGGSFTFGSPPNPEIDLGSAVTGVDGTFEVQVFIAGRVCDIKVGFDPGAGASVALDPDDQFIISSPQAFRPLPGQRRIGCVDEGATVGGVDAVVSANQVNLGGQVFTTSGDPLGGGVTVELYLQNEDGTRGEFVDSVTAASSGRVGFYAFWAPAPACYLVVFPEFLVGPPPDGIVQIEQDVCVTPGEDQFDVSGVGGNGPIPTA